MQLSGYGIQGKISGKILGNIAEGIFNNIVWNSMRGNTVFLCVFHNVCDCVFKGKNIP